MLRRLLDTLPRGYTLDEREWQRRHRLLLWVLGLHIPGLAVLGFMLGKPPLTVGAVLLVPAAAVGLGILTREHRRTASVIVTFGLVYCSATLVAFTDGRIEAHFHFFIIIGFIALYQDWAPFLLNIVFTVISHGIGSAWQRDLIFDHAAGQANPWYWSLIHGIAVLFACLGMMLFWRVTEDSQEEKDRLSHQLSEIEIGRRQFTSELLTNLARRNQSLLYRQLDIISQLEESEQDPDALAELFRLDHIATRVRRNAENLLVLSGEQPPRTWSDPVRLHDVLRAAIAETEDLTRVVIVVDEQTAVVGHAVTDLTHLLAELTENAVRFSPPDSTVTVRSRLEPRQGEDWLLTVEDWGIGMAPDVLAATNALLADPPELDMSVSQRLGFHVVARLAVRHGIRVSLSPTPGSGVTAVVRIPGVLTTSLDGPVRPAAAGGRVPGHGMEQPEPVSVAAARLPHPRPRPQPEMAQALMEAPLRPQPSPRSGAHPRPQPGPSALPEPPQPRPQPGLRPPQSPPLAVPVGQGQPWEVATWDGWWEPPGAGTPDGIPGGVPAAAPVATAPAAIPAKGAMTTTTNGDATSGAPATTTGLRRRVPQTHLVEQLRLAGDDDAAQAPNVTGHEARAGREAADALTRYQAARATASRDGLR